MKLRLAAIALIVLGFLAVFGAPASAHALLVRSIPDANGQLDRAPAQVELFFSESLEPAFSTVSVLDSSGAKIDAGDAHVDPTDATHMVVSLPSLADGVYTVSWKALSATDGHLTTGAFPFAVGKADAAALAAAGQGSRQAPLSLGEVLAKWLLYLSAAAVTGGMMFVLTVWQPARRLLKGETRGDQAVDVPWVPLVRGSLILLLVVHVLALLVQAGQASGTGLSAPWSRSVHTVLFQTRFGAIWLGRLALIFVLARLTPAAVEAEGSGRRGRWLEGACMAASLLLLLTASLGSHASAEAAPLLPVVMDWVHLIAASAWIGGLFFFIAGLRSLRELPAEFRTRLTARLIPRFSVLAIVSMAALTLTGLFSAVVRVGTIDALLSSLYGHALVVKLAIVLIMLTLGATNLLIVSPRMKRAAASDGGNGRLVDRFRRIVWGEVTLAAVLLLSVGVLTSLPPARVPASNPALTGTADVDDLRLVMTITPGRVGINTFTVEATAGGQPLRGAKEVDLRFTPSSGKVPASQLQLAGQGNGAYSAKGGYLSLPDSWQVQVAVRRAGKFDSYANLTFDIGTGGSASTAIAWSRLAATLAVLCACGYAVVFLTRGRVRVRQVALGLVPALALLGVGAVTFLTPPLAPTSGTVNPIPPNAASVARGQAIYAQRCVPCHGESGKGDGPVGLTLNPRPADLTIHAVPGVHTDAQLFEWITNGFPGSIMPHFGKVLSDNDRWDLVNFIRTFAPRTSP
jgi:copper transport protein